ncbi:MAG: hypothetical protein K0R50_4885 [Eubacterium sp.]|jgi:hypothetical protein|nr:hypothetical protein [Clostridia bacterium]MDF2989375.1 hypothetical protein [Eubacterium sp.]
MSKVFSTIGLETNTGIRDVGLMSGILLPFRCPGVFYVGGIDAFIQGFGGAWSTPTSKEKDYRFNSPLLCHELDF